MWLLSTVHCVAILKALCVFGVASNPPIDSQRLAQALEGGWTWTSSGSNVIIWCTFVKRGRKSGRKNICLLGREEERRRGQPGQTGQAGGTSMRRNDPTQEKYSIQPKRPRATANDFDQRYLWWHFSKGLFPTHGLNNLMHFSQLISGLRRPRSYYQVGRG